MAIKGTEIIHSEPVRRQGRILRAWVRHPRVALAIRGALAASIAWYLARFLPEPMSEYPYYAPLGAVIATTFTLAGSVRESLQAVAAIAIGGTIAYVGDLVAVESSPVTVAAVVALGVLAAGWGRLGSMASWVPTAALFTLIIGGGEAFYIWVYGGLIFLGGAIGIAINAIFPSLPLAPLWDAIEDIRNALADQLDELADGLDHDEPPDTDQWKGRSHDLAAVRREMRSALQDSNDARRGNLRAKRHLDELQRQRRHADSLDRVALLVADATDLVTTEENAGREQLALGRELRPPAARALRALAEALRSVENDAADEDAVAETRAALNDLTDAIDRSRTSAPGGGIMAAGSLAVAIRRCLDQVPGTGN
ncbi:FUSC family protein [Georgenia subflava]|uniref:FUSC family protein n=1 Tax=Georgenia subflava TaxID=1622177 RepID=UPI00126523CC|nr:hypothetical protein [Georgenia subflava]